jgi:hypothetical protein
MRAARRSAPRPRLLPCLRAPAAGNRRAINLRIRFGRFCALVDESLAGGAAETFVEELLVFHQHLRHDREHRFRHGAGRVEQLARRHHAIDQAPRLRFGRGQEPGGEGKLLGAMETDAAGQADGEDAAVTPTVSRSIPKEPEIIAI